MWWDDEEEMDDELAVKQAQQSKPKRQRVRLKDINVTAIALVDKAANGERFVIAKRAPDEHDEAERTELLKRLEAMSWLQFQRFWNGLATDEKHLVLDAVEAEVQKRDDELAELDEKAEEIQQQLDEIREGKFVKGIERMTPAEADDFIACLTPDEASDVVAIVEKRLAA